jgi:hypothetical protein
MGRRGALMDRILDDSKGLRSSIGERGWQANGTLTNLRRNLRFAR